LSRRKIFLWTRRFCSLASAQRNKQTLEHYDELSALVSTA
jgi:hypothetical protein